VRGAAALEHVLDIAAEHGSTVHVLTVMDTVLYSPFQMEGDVVDALEREGDRIVRDAADRAEGWGIDARSPRSRTENRIERLSTTQRRTISTSPSCRRTAVGALEQFLLGSTTERVVRRADGPVLTIRPDAETKLAYPYRHVLAPTDGSECARDALELGVDVASTTGAALHLLTVVDVVSVGVDVRSRYQNGDARGGCGRDPR